MKALVIGATGIIGNHVVRELLSQGIEVRALSRGVTPSINLKGLNVETVNADLNDSAALTRAMKGCGWVFHTAPYYPTNAFDRRGHLERALKGINSVLNAAAANPIERFVYTSSLTTIGKPKKPGQLADENCPYDLQGNPPHPYFEVKYVMEEEVRRQALIGRVPGVIVNPTGCFGPYELKPVQLCLVPQVLNGKVPAMIRRPINYIDTALVAQGHRLAAEKGRISYRYILGDHNGTADEVIRIICKVAKRPPPKITLPLKMAIPPALFSEAVCYYLLKKPPFIPLLGLRFIEYGQHFNLTRAREDLGLKSAPLEPCIERAIEWFKSIGYC